MSVQNNQLLSGATATGSSDAASQANSKITFHARGKTSAGSGSATVLIEVSNDQGASKTWHTLGTISLTLSTSYSADGFASNAPWKYYRARISAISGTGAQVDVEAAEEV